MLTMIKSVTIYEFYDILERAIAHIPEPLAEHTHHLYQSDFFTLLSIVLSARTKDSLTITKLPKLWDSAKTPEDYASIDIHQLEQLLKPIGFYKTKAKHLKKLSEMIISTFHRQIPKTMEGLLQLPGVGRKTANLYLSVVLDTPAICVDTHVHRIMNHIGYVHTKTPEETEMALRKKLPQDLWKRTNRILVVVGQFIANHTQIKNPENLLNQYNVN